MAGRLLFGDGCEVVGDRLVQRLAGGGDPRVDAALSRVVECAFSALVKLERSRSRVDRRRKSSDDTFNGVAGSISYCP